MTQWLRAVAPGLTRTLASLKGGTRFTFVGSSETGQTPTIEGRVLGPGREGGVAILVKERDQNQPTGWRWRADEWSGRTKVLPVEEVPDAGP